MEAKGYMVPKDSMAEPKVILVDESKLKKIPVVTPKGDTVNTASRMESSGEVGKINISGATYELIKDKIICTHRGKIFAKGKGEIDMYFVESIL